MDGRRHSCAPGLILDPIKVSGVCYISSILSLYLVMPERKSGIVWLSIPKDALAEGSQYCYDGPEYIEIQAANINARLKAEIDDITC